ncbi:MAG: PAS domain S-box protein [Acidobacteria bacterium]|nr:PAS domain S-box protein [Acidobacteriota bacterium]MBV9067883.1 PAS domain S-box protein [Acidobacteriota bacterium]MBV9186762.1 PAS domain S-box protein [Acidobacteriota bacterium]
MRLLLLEDSEHDAELTIAALERDGLAFEKRVVATRDEYLRALNDGPWSAIISDYHLPGFSGIEALRLLRERDADLPFIVHSGTIGEARAVEAMRAGANDYVMKDDLGRLAPAIEREIRDADTRRERTRLERDLKAAEARYHRAFRNAPIGVCSADAKGFIIEANDEYCRLAGKPADIVVGSHFTALIPAAEIAAAVARYEEFLRSPRLHDQYERRYRHSDRSIRIATVTMSKVLTDEGKFESVVVLANDITALRIAEESNRLSKEQLDEAQVIANVGSWEYDLATRTLSWSAGLRRVHGFEADAKPDPERVYETILPDDREVVRSVLESAANATDPFSIDYRILRDGDVRTLHGRGRTVRDGSGRPIKIFGTVQDITERVHREQELHRTAVQQAAVAHLGQAALSGMSPEFLLNQTATVVSIVLEVEFSEVLQRQNGSLILIAGEGWDENAIGTTKVSSGRGSQAAFTLDSGPPVILSDIHTETRFEPSELVRRHGVVSGITVAIDCGEAEPWGVLGIYTRSKRSFSTTDIDFLRSVAIVLGQAMERWRAEAELRTRALQQNAIADLGQSALASFDDGTLQQACDLVRRGLDVEWSIFAELNETRDSLFFRAGVWGDVMPLESPVRENTHVGLTVLSGKPVVVNDYESAAHLVTAKAALSAGVRSGLCVPVASATKIYGVLTAHSKVTRNFGASDIDFVQALANILADAMERAGAQQQLIESEKRYRTVVEGASEIIFTIDAEGRLVTLNRAFESITGWRCEEWISRPFLELIHQGDVRKCLELFRDLKETTVVVERELLITGRDKSVLLHVTSFPEIRDGVRTETYGFARDVTEERKTEREREQVTRNLQLVLESTVEGMYTMDVTGRCTMVNRAAARMLGWSREELLGRNIHDTMHSRHPDGNPYAAEQCPIQHVLWSSATRSVSSDTFWRRDGIAVPVDYSAAPIIDNGAVVGVVVAFMDVSERRKLELKLEQANRLSALGRMAATIAHEFNNVLMGIAPFVDLIRRDPKRVETAVDHIARSVARGRRITHDILRFTQPAELNRSVFDAESCLQTVALEARSILSSAYKVDVHSRDPRIAVEADENQIHQIVMNLVLNARDAMPGGGRFTMAVRREPAGAQFPFGIVEAPERFAHFILRDTGCGIGPEILQHIFEPLYTTKPSGTGLGLAVTHQVVQRHGGEIFVESEVGLGTTFHIFLPLAAEDAGSAAVLPEAGGEIPEAGGNHQQTGGTVRVLLVEDDPAVSSGVSALLELEGLEVDVASSGHEAIERVSRALPDVMVLDVGLPDIDGTEVYRKVMVMHPGLPVIFSTGHADRGQLDELSPGGEVFYLLKPFEFGLLIETIHSAVARA